MRIDINDLIVLLTALLAEPRTFSYLEQDYADALEQAGYFSVLKYEVTALGRDILSTVKVD